MRIRNSLKVKVLSLLAIIALGAGALLPQPISAFTLSEHTSSHFLDDYFTDFSQVVYVEGSVLLNDIDQASVYAFVSDLENDPLWYPGTLSSELISGDGGPGTKYQEVVAFGPEPVTITATVLATKPNKQFMFTSDSFLVNVTQYDIRKRPHGDTKLTIRSFVQLPPGFTEEALEGYLSLVLNTLPAALGTTGTVTIE